MPKHSDTLRTKLLDHFRHYTRDPRVWRRLWLEVFHYQVEHNPVYRRFLEAWGVRTQEVRNWRDIPPVPVALFKTRWVGTVSPHRARAVFRSSGTTRGSASRSVHPFYDLDLYRVAAMAHFRHMVMPDRERMRMLLLGPSARILSESSLGQMLDWIAETFATPDSLHAWTPDGPDFERATDWIQRHGSKEPLIIFGTAIALYEWIAWMEAQGVYPPTLPPGSRIVETGGFKGRRVEITKSDFYRKLAATFGVPERLIGAEYGMTEMGSQFYDNTFRAALTGRTVSRRLVGPPWVRVVVWDPERWCPADGEGPGPLAFIDPVNLDSIAFIVTEDVGVVREDGLELMGRLPGAEPRGCSLIA